MVKSKKTIDTGLSVINTQLSIQKAGNKKIGRPSKLNLKEMIPCIIELGKQGASKARIAVELGIDIGTLADYTKQDKTFNQAIKEANTLAEAYWEKLMHDNIMIDKNSPRVDTIAWIFNMKNRFGWKDKTELSSDKDAPLIINLDVKASKV